ncbi:MAG: protein kinase [Acidobacteriota bacterium]|nr:protein kinase [Acidobacteriota bacterium]
MTEQLIGQTLAGKYRIEQLLREDAFGKTFRATHVLMEKAVAVKILNPELATNAPVVADFQQEAKLLSRLSHPHVLGVTDYGVDEQRGVPFLVMENFDGQTLKDLIQEEGAQPLRRAVTILTQTADALSIAHENGLIHGALRSDSILLAGSGSRDFVKVVDFDAANKTSNIDFFDRETAHGNPESAAYLSPEQCNDSSQTDARSDIYSLGIILYEVLTGRLPFVGSSTTEVMMKHAQEIPPSLLAVRQDLQPTFEQIVQRALAKNPAQRFQTAEEFSAALTTAAEGGPLPIYQREADTIVRPRAESAVAGTATDARWRTAFIVLAGISLLSVALFYFTQNPRTTPPTDPNSSPVFPINPATGAPEQNLSPDFSNLQFNTNIDGNISTVPPAGTVTDVPYGGRIPPGLYPQGQQVYVDPNSNSPFMQDLNQPPVAPSPSPRVSPKPSVSPTPAGSPAVSPTPQTSPKPPAQPTPAATQPPATTPKPTPPPTRNTPVPKPTQPTTEKSAQNLSERISEY